jgi:hypothetical protein
MATKILTHCCRNFSQKSLILKLRGIKATMATMATRFLNFILRACFSSNFVIPQNIKKKDFIKNVQLIACLVATFTHMLISIHVTINPGKKWAMSC